MVAEDDSIADTANHTKTKVQEAKELWDTIMQEYEEVNKIFDPEETSSIDSTRIINPSEWFSDAKEKCEGLSFADTLLCTLSSINDDLSGYWSSLFPG